MLVVPGVSSRYCVSPFSECKTVHGRVRWRQAQRERKKNLKVVFKSEEQRLLWEKRNGRSGVSVHKL